MKLNQLNRYKLNLKIKALGNFVWGVLVAFSELMLFFFFLITSLIFWINFAIEFPVLKDLILKMILIVLIGVGILILKRVKNL